LTHHTYATIAAAIHADHVLNPAPPRSDVYLAIARSAEVLQRLPIAHPKWLSESERERLQSLRVAERRDHYLAGHWLVRELLVQAFPAASPRVTRPENWSLRETKSQAPCVIGHSSLRLSISHSGNWIAAAVAEQPVGIDIEQRPRALDPAIHNLLLGPNEVAGDIDNDELLERWVVKEAWLKMRGISALPERLRLLEMREVGDEPGDVISFRGEHFHFAVAAAQNTTLTWTNGTPVVRTGAFRSAPST